MKLVSLADLSAADIENIWSLAAGPDHPVRGCIGWSFEGNGIRTRTAFLHAFRDLGLESTELPNLLKTHERVEDLAGYLDPFYSAYVIRESNHERLQAFANASSRPVINAMSSRGHPCEVLTDAYFIDRQVKPLRDARICLWGPTTNVFRSWHELAHLTGATVVQVSAEQQAQALPNIDVVVTDSWPEGAEPAPVALSLEHLERMGSPVLLPTPPFRVGRELGFDPVTYSRFAGYAQKHLLLPMHKAILRYAAQG